jgi:DNA replication initiation complex subunit (GINS family)
MYNELYAAWRREVDEASLGSLPPDFYVRIADYLKRVREENRLSDKKSVKACLLDHEAKNVELMLEELLWARYKKLLEAVSQNQKLPFELLTVEEAKMCESFTAFSSAYEKFTIDLLQSQTAAQAVAKAETEVGHKRVTLRFTKNIPAIMGTDMKSYGPFLVEDVASLPVENAKVLVKQGLAVLVEVS